MPGIHAKNSKPVKEFSRAKFETFLSKAEAPAIILFLSFKEICEKDFPNFIITPSKPPSLINIFDPAPKTLILPLSFMATLRWRRFSGKLFAGFSFIIGTICIIFTFTRGAWLGLIISAI